MREPISPYHRLAVTLRCLASGNTFEDLKFLTAITPQTIGKIVIETCEAINQVLKNCIKLPNNSDEWKAEAYDSSKMWNFPHCIGAIDGKHVNIVKPPGSVVNANYQFLMVHVGANGRASDAGLLNDLEMLEKLKKNELCIPDPEPLPGLSSNMPYVFVGDDAFPLMENLMKPYSHTTMKREEIIFNYRLSRARRIVENTFGILASRFRILLKTINLSPEKVTTIVLTCCYLHNFLRERKVYRNNRMTDGLEFSEPSSDENNLDNLTPTTIRNASNLAKEVRDKFCEYFNTVGTVPWQNKICKQ
ncbi:protein ALP1-like [Rhagoletis pomonella]|uniref:protein ALP1-like n=1 Tax=Rhagoletis pomonella TaxID=28610 RepID=UPI0017810EAD|nr:protein ALP1-like [Rhagoletis pomonella]